MCDASAQYAKISSLRAQLYHILSNTDAYNSRDVYEDGIKDQQHDEGCTRCDTRQRTWRLSTDSVEEVCHQDVKYDITIIVIFLSIILMIMQTDKRKNLIANVLSIA